MKYKINPIAKPRMTRSDKWKQRPCVMQYRAFKDECRLLRITLGEVCNLVFHIEMPSSWSAKKKAEMVGKPHKQRPDLDNMTKAVWDAVLEDDSHIHELHAKKVWAYEGAIEIL